MKILPITISLVWLLWTSFSYAAERAKDISALHIPTGFYNEAARPGYNYWKEGYVPLFLDGGYPITGTQEEKAYIGQKFPIYCGYLTFGPNKQIRFTPKTDLPIDFLLQEIELVSKNNGLFPGENVRLIFGFKPVEIIPIDHDYFYAAFFMQLYDSGVKRPIGFPEDFTGNIEEFNPIFDEACIYKKWRDCSFLKGTYTERKK